MQKSICVRTQIAKTAHLQPSIFRLLFDSYPLPLLRRLTMGAAIEKNFFIFQSRLTRFKFLDISQGFRFFGLSNINYRFDSIQVLLDIYSFVILVFASEFILASISTCFSIVYSML